MLTILKVLITRYPFPRNHLCVFRANHAPYGRWYVEQVYYAQMLSLGRGNGFGSNGWPSPLVPSMAWLLGDAGSELEGRAQHAAIQIRLQQFVGIVLALELSELSEGGGIAR